MYSKIILQNSENVLQHDEHVLPNGENVLQHDENVLQHGENVLQHYKYERCVVYVLFKNTGKGFKMSPNSG